MARIKKRGASGAAKNFVTRSQAIAKLQVTLADFRRLCIFKGIYPREPTNKKRANKGSTKPVTFYYAKDIQYLLHEPVLAKFREYKAFSKKLNRALSRNELSDADILERKKPQYTLDHLVRQRYPSFLDALRDLDDPLNMLFLFANMPATKGVEARVTQEAARLTNQWLAYVARERLIKKVFVSIKGVYYQATVKGQEIRWLVPFKFPANIPSDVDFRIMLTFLEFYSTMVHFVLFKLYSDADLVYPPPLDNEASKGISGLSNYVMQSRSEQTETKQTEPAAQEDTAEATQLSEAELAKAKAADKEEVETVEGDNVETVELDEFSSANKTPGDLLVQPSRFSSPTSTIFADFTFFVGREVSVDILELCILSGGGKFISEIVLDDMKLNHPDAYAKLDLSSITHQIVDRPKVVNKVAGRTYVQPQWVFDSINQGELVSVNAYAPGETLPPHLSPWGDAGAYDPSKPEDVESEESEEEVEGEEEEEDEDLREQKELEMEAKGIKFSEAKSEPKKKKAKKSTEDEEKELKKIMMTNKQQKLYAQMQHGIEKKDDRVAQLAKKRKQIEKAKAKK